MIAAVQRRPLLALALLSALASIHLLTIRISPTVWQDEVQIVDYGRNFLAHDPQWSISWSPAQTPVTPLSYLGPVMQEMAYRAWPGVTGPRLLSLVGAVLAAYLLFRWLLARDHSAQTALALAAVFLLDPLFVQGYRGARVDAWVFVLVFAACILVARPSQLRAALAGALVVVAGFVWPSAIFLTPLVLIELRRRRDLWGIAAGAVVALALCAWPLLAQLQLMLSDTAGVVEGASGDRAFTDVVRYFAASVAQSPLVMVAAVAGLMIAGRRVMALGVALGAVLLVMSQMTIHVHRVVYLLPYLLPIIAAACERLFRSDRRAIAQIGLLALIAWAFILSLVLRPALAWSARDARDPKNYDRAASAMPFLQSRLVFLGAWELYYAGRQHGWRMVRADPGIGPEAYRAMLDRLDYALIPADDPAAPVSMLTGMGWRVVAQFTLPSPAPRLLAAGEPAARRYDVYTRKVFETMINR